MLRNELNNTWGHGLRVDNPGLSRHFFQARQYYTKLVAFWQVVFFRNGGKNIRVLGAGYGTGWFGVSQRIGHVVP